MTRDHVHQSRFMHWLLLGRVVCFTAALAITVVGTTALADELAGAEEALKHMNATLSTVESAAKYAKQGNGSETSLHCRQAITHAEQAIKAMPMGNPHGREAASLLEEAIENLNSTIEFADQGNAKKAKDRVNTALDFTDAAISHVLHSH